MEGSEIIFIPTSFTYLPFSFFFQPRFSFVFPRVKELNRNTIRYLDLVLSFRNRHLHWNLYRSNWMYSYYIIFVVLLIIINISLYYFSTQWFTIPDCYNNFKLTKSLKQLPSIISCTTSQNNRKYSSHFIIYKHLHIWVYKQKQKQDQNP